MPAKSAHAIIELSRLQTDRQTDRTTDRQTVQLNDWQRETAAVAQVRVTNENRDSGLTAGYRSTTAVMRKTTEMVDGVEARQRQHGKGN